MSRTTIQKLLMTTALVVSFAAITPAQAATLTITADGNIGAATGTAGTNGTTGASATNGTNGQDGAFYNTTNVDGIANANITGGVGGNGGDDTNGNGSGTVNGGNGGTGSSGVYFNNRAGSTLTINSGITVTGGDGGNGGTVGAGVGNGGDGGDGAAGVTSTGGTVTVNGDIHGGHGGNGSAGFGGGTTGQGGDAGDGLYISGSTSVVLGSVGSIQGGTAGTGGTGQFDGNGITVDGTGVTVTITGPSGSITGGNNSAALTAGLEVVSGATGNTISNEAIIGSATGNGLGVLIDANTTSFANTGTIQSSTAQGFAVNTGDTLGTLTNSGTGTIKSGSTAVAVGGTITSLVNSSGGAGGIRATGATGVALAITGDVGAINNTDGVITSANTSTTTSGTVTVGADLAGMTITGGTVSNSTAGNAIAITADQTGAISTTGTVSSTGGNAIRFQAANGSITNTGTITGNITSSAGSKVQTVTNTSGTIGGNITLDDGADVVNLNGGQINGNVDLGAAGDTFTYGHTTSATGLNGTLAFGTGANTFAINQNMTTGGAVTTTAGNTTNATVAATKTFTAAHDVDLADGTLTNNGTIQINAGHSVKADADVVGASGKYVFEVATATAANGAGASNGLLDLTGSTNQSGINAVSDVEVKMASGSSLANGANIRVVRGGAAESTDFAGESIVEDSYLYKFAIWNGNDGGVTYTGAGVNDIVLVVSRDGANTTSSETAKAVDAPLANIGSGGDPNFDQIQTNVAAATTDEEYSNILEALAPATDNAVSTASASASVGVINLAGGRLDAGRDMSSGSETLGNRVWVQGFGTTASQDALNGSDGYDADTYGGAIGTDGKIINEDTSLGAALSYGRTNIDAKNANTTETDIDSYQLTVYGDHSFGEGTFVEGIAAYAMNKVESDRHNVGGIVGLTASSDYDAQTYAARAGVGHKFGVEGGIAITPKVFAEYVAYDPDSYTETGAGSANLTVDGDISEQLNVGANIEISSNLVGADGSLVKPSVNIGYKHDTINDNVSSTSTFAAGGGSFVTKGSDQDADTFTAGAGIDYYSAGNFQLTFDYGYEAKEEYDSHTGVARASYRF